METQAELGPHAYRFKVEYDGGKYHGWQIQKGQSSVQETLQDAVRIFTGETVHVVGSGRTDTGVHARGQVAKFHTHKALDPYKAQKSINGILPPSIAIREFEACDPEFQPRFHALSRYYIYTVITRKSCINAEFAWEVSRWQLDLEKIQREAESFLGEHDFIGFCIPRNDDKSTLCFLDLVRVEPFDGGFRLHIRGNRFLHRMVRSIVGCLIDVGRGHHPEGTVRSILAGTFAKPRTWAPPYGLVLEKVEYKDF
jgi:tRNA pseudouridine38-40 synthase